MNVEYIYEDNDIIVCHKPAGMATEGAPASRMDLVSAVRNYLGRRDRGKKPYVATVHRLDQPVEGVVVLAKNKNAATKLAAQIKGRTTEKRYYALCYGVPSEDSARLIDNVGRGADGKAFVQNESGAGAEDIKKAELEYRVVYKDESKALLDVKLITGRFHQIRVQMAHMGDPLLGDRKYGNQESLDYSAELGIKDVCLVCYKFSFVHPGTGKKVNYEIIPENPQIKEILEQRKGIND